MLHRLAALCLALLPFSSALYGDNIGLLIVATGKYISYAKPLIESAQKHFCTNHNVTYYVFTDGAPLCGPNIITIHQNRLGWPYDTMMRGHIYLAHADSLRSQDYLFACDADMLFVDQLGDEILGERVATQHPGFVNKRGSYETNPLSTACVSEDEGEQYFAGGFYGGRTAEFLHIAQTNAFNIDTDLHHHLIAVWHDESHWNRYCIDFKPTVILCPAYCYPENWDLPYAKKLLALDKNHDEMRCE